MRQIHNYEILKDTFLFEEDWEKAKFALHRLIQLESDGEKKISYYYELADLYWQTGDLIEAQKLYRTILFLKREEPGAFYALGILAWDVDKNMDKALFYLQEAIKLDPEYREAYYFQSLLWCELGDRDRAKELLFQCLVLEPEDFIALTDLSSYFEEEGDYEQAERYVKEAIALAPYYSEAYYNLGVIYQRTGELEDALSSYLQAIALSPYEAKYYLNASAIYLEWEACHSAIDILTEGIDLSLGSVNLYYNRACSKARLGLTQEAKEDLDRAIEINSDALMWARRDEDLLEITKEYYDHH